MADKDMKPGAKKLYDNPRSKTSKPADDVPEAKKADAAKPKDKMVDGTPDPTNDKMKVDQPDPTGDKMMVAKDKFMDAMKGMAKTQESERRDTHNNHREAMRMMHARHQKQANDLIDEHMAGLSSGDAEAPEMAAAEPAAPAEAEA